MRLGAFMLAATLAAGAAGAQGLPGVGLSGGSWLPPGLAAAGTDYAAAALAALVREGAREAALHGPQPLDGAMRAAARGFPADTLDRARWLVAPPGSRLRAVMFADGPVDAVTLGDVVVFRDAAAAGDGALLRHELGHVVQYGRWGVDGFARRYVLDPVGVERDAQAIADAARPGLARSARPVPRPR